LFSSLTLAAEKNHAVTPAPSSACPRATTTPPFLTRSCPQLRHPSLYSLD
jgi:hypothetical protein